MENTSSDRNVTSCLERIGMMPQFDKMHPSMTLGAFFSEKTQDIFVSSNLFYTDFLYIIGNTIFL